MGKIETFKKTAEALDGLPFTVQLLALAALASSFNLRLFHGVEDIKEPNKTTFQLASKHFKPRIYSQIVINSL